MLKNRFLLLKLFSALILFSCYSNAQEESYLATFGNTSITTKQFIQKYELVPHIFEKGNQDSLRFYTLYSLIAEKMWAKEAYEMGLASTRQIMVLTKQMNKLFARDALFKDSVESKIIITREELQKAEKYRSIKLKVSIVSTVDSVTAKNIYYQLLNIPVDSLKLIFPYNNYSINQQDISFGDLDDEKIENELFRARVNDCIGPINNGSGWFVFKIMSRDTNPTDSTISTSLSLVKDLIKTRRAKKIGEIYLHNLIGKIRVENDKEIFLKIVDLIYQQIESDSVLVKNIADDPVYISENIINKIKNEFRTEYLDKPFVFFRDTPASIGDFFDHLELFGMKVYKLDRSNIAANLRLKLNDFIREELITKEALRLGYDLRPEVKNETQMWTDSFLFQFLQNRFVDSVSVNEKDAYNYYLQISKKDKNLEKVKIIEILVNDLDTAQKVLDEIASKKDFKKIAEIYNQRESTKKTNGEYDYFPISEHAEIGKIASRLSMNQVYGPIKLPEGYSIIKLIDRKDSDDLLTKSYEEVKEQLKLNLKIELLQDKLNSFTTKLADKYNLKIDFVKFNTIKLNEINMFTYRFIGFGGRIASVPLATQMYEWYYKWKAKNNLNQ